MKLYCHACNALHEYAPGEVERIVYALDAAHADSLTDNDLRVDGDAFQALNCYETVLHGALDSEVYYEHVQNCVENRRGLTGRAAVDA